MDSSHDGGIHLDHHVRQPHRNGLERQEEHPLLLPVGDWKYCVARIRCRVGSVQPCCAGYRPFGVRHLGDLRVEKR